MRESLRRLFKVHEGEVGKVVHFTLLGALLEAGVAIGVSTSDTLFLVHLGPEHLPVVYLLLPVIMLAFTPAFSYLATRYGIDRLFKGTLVLLMIGGTFCLVAALGFIEKAPSIAYLIKLYTSLWAISLFSLFWNYVDCYFDMLDAKRLFAVFSGGTALGAALGGGLVSLCAHFFAVEALFVVWGALALMTWPVLLSVGRRWKKLSEEGEPENRGFLEQTLETGRIMKRSRYVVLLNVALVFSVFLTMICEYQYLGIFSQNQTKEELAVLFGVLFACTNIFNLFVNFFLFSRMVVRLGVRNVALIQPLAYLAAFAFLYWNYGWGAAVFGFFAYQGIQNSIENNNWNFVMNAVPSEAKSQVRTFTEGISEPVATSLAGAFLLFGGPLLAGGDISLLSLGTSLLFLGVTFWMRHDYLRALVANLKKEWLDFSRSESTVLGLLEKEELSYLKLKAGEEDFDAACAAMHLLAQHEKSLALETLLHHLDSTDIDDADQQKVETLLLEILREADTETLTRIIRALRNDRLLSNPTFLGVLGARGMIQTEFLRNLLESESPTERAAAAVARWSSWNVAGTAEAIDVIQNLLTGNEAERVAAVRAIGQLGQERYAHYLAGFLKDRSSRVRGEALRSINRLCNRDSSHLVKPILEVISTGDKHQRSLGIQALCQIGDPRCIVPLLSLRTVLTPAERRSIEQLILDIGLKSVPTVVTVLKDRSFDYGARSIAARVLGKLAFPQFEAGYGELIRAEMQAAYECLYSHFVLQKGAVDNLGLAVLSSLKLDVQKATVEFILELLTIGGRLPDFELISSSLRSKSPKVRASAIESVEQACTRELFKQLLPLVDSRPLEDQVSFYRKEFAGPELNREQVISGALESSEPLEVAAAVQALFEMDPSGAAPVLRRKLSEARSPLLKETLLSLLRRLTQPDAELNSVERLYYLLRIPALACFGTPELSTLLSCSSVMEFPTDYQVFRKGDPAGQFFVVLHGRARLTNGRPGSFFREEWFGEESLWGTRKRVEDAFSEGLKALVLDSDEVFEAARRYPKIAAGLLEKHLETR